MPTVSTNGIQIAYEVHGCSHDAVLLLVQGLGMPLAAWPPPLIDALVAEGFRVITFDNRDIGRSELLDHLAVPNIIVQTLRKFVGLKVNAPYQLADMMGDVRGLIDALDIDAVHLVGVSMGGMISQLLALAEPERVTSLVSIMSTTNERGLPGPTKAVRRHIVRGPSEPTREARLAYHWQLWRLLGSPGYPLSEEELGTFLQRIFDRGMTADGTARQMLAIMATPGRRKRLRQLRVPTLVIHGDADPLVPIACGVDTANAIPDAQMVRIDGMGHDLPVALVPRLSRLIADHARAAGSRAGNEVA